MYNNYLEQSLSQCKLHIELFLLLWLLLLLTIYYLQYLYSPIGQFGKGSGNPLQHSCLENPMDGEAWRASAESWTRLKWLRTHTCTAQLVKNPPAMQKTLVQFLGQEHPLEKDLLQILQWYFSRGSPGRSLEKDLLQILQWYWSITPVFLGFLCGSAGKKSTYNEGNLGLIPRLGRSPGEGKSYPLQYSGLENSKDYTVQRIQRVTKSWTGQSNFHFPFKPM